MNALSDLTSHRIRQGVTLQQIAGTTKISRRYLEAIERGAFKELPGGVYTINYLRQYAQAVGWDESALVAYYRQVSGTAGSD